MNLATFKYFLIVTCVAGFVLSAQGQERYYRAGLKYFERGLYGLALKEFNQDEYAHRNKDLLLKRVICNYEVNKLDAAKKDVPTVLSFEQIPEKLYLYIARIYHSELNFEKAIEYYKLYLRKTGRNDKYRLMVIDEIKRCAKGLDFKYLEQGAFVENMGPDINTPYDETDPVQSPNFLNKYYFSSNRKEAEGGPRDAQGHRDDAYGKHYLDMFSATLENGRWTEIVALNPLLNTAKHERVLDFNSSGSVLFFAKGSHPSQAAVHVDTFGVQTSEIYPPKFQSPVIGEQGDVYLRVHNDSTIIFASKRKGGYGGYDLYVSFRQGKHWSQAKNMGPEINSSYDEISPFITQDGRTLYFSSNGLKSIGGFDIFKSNFRDEKWSQPENLLLGINSAGDDTHFRLSADGQFAYFRSERKSGYGQGDLYTAYLKKQELGQLGYNPVLPFIANDDFVMDIANNKAIAINKNSSEPVPAPVNPVEAIKHKEFVLENLYYGEDENLITTQNNKTLENIVDIMTIYPSTKIEIDCHSIKESQVAYELYFTLKRAEKISDYLIDKGVSKDRILIRGFGAGYPLVKNENFQAQNLAERLNRRIEIRLSETENLPLTIQYVEPVVADFLRDSSIERKTEALVGLSYRVKIATVRQMYQNEILNDYKDAMIERDFGSDDYIYYIGLYNRYFEAQEVVRALVNDNVNDVRIIPYIDGIMIPKENIMELTLEYPDLVNYLQYNGQ